MKRILFAAAIALGALSGCGQMATRDNPALAHEQQLAASASDAIAAGYVSVTQTRALALDLLRERTVTPDQAERANARLDEARSALDGARVLLAAARPDSAAANTRVQSATAAIAAARALLATRKATP